MNTQALTNWKALPLLLLLLAFTSVSMAGEKARSKLPTISDIAETTSGFGILYVPWKPPDWMRHLTAGVISPYSHRPMMPSCN